MSEDNNSLFPDTISRIDSNYNTKGNTPKKSDNEEIKEALLKSPSSPAEGRFQCLVWSWGRNRAGELGHGGTAISYTPRQVNSLKGKNVVWVSSGAQHSAVVTTRGELLICGSYLHGKLGIENFSNVNLTTFKPVPTFIGKKVRQVACGDYHTLCLLEDGKVYAWGGSLHKKLGAREGGKDFRSPAHVVGLRNVKRVACGDFHSIALTEGGKVYSWGGGGSFFNKGQCGHGNDKDIQTPALIKSLENKNVVDIVCGGYHTLALTDGNELYAWGAGLYGECGFGNFSHSNSPKLVMLSSKNTPEVHLFTKNREQKVKKYPLELQQKLIMIRPS